MSNSFAVEVRTVSCAPDAWTGNGQRFATREEAEQWGSDLLDRWFAVTGTRVVESDDASNVEG